MAKSAEKGAKEDFFGSSTLSAKIRWYQSRQGLRLHFPEALPCEVAYGFKIEVNGKLDDSPRNTMDDGVERAGDFPVYRSER